MEKLFNWIKFIFGILFVSISISIYALFLFVESVIYGIKSGAKYFCEGGEFCL